MKNFIHIISIVFPVTACLLAVTVILLNLFLMLRRRLPVKVNCWFCNSWTKVLYDYKNSFECPTCLQYNGFDEDGDYNRHIPEQYDESLNEQLFNYKQAQRNHKGVSNGLCVTCNHNQYLKVRQLAQYVPLVEKNYDVEIEHFQKQLEKAYKLCSKCESVLQQTIRKQNTSIFGLRVRQLQRKGISLLDLNKSYNGSPKKPIFISLIRCSLLILCCLILVNILMSFDYSDKNLKQRLPRFSHNFILKSKQSIIGISEYGTPYFNVFAQQYDHFCHSLEHIRDTVAEGLLSIPFLQHSFYVVSEYMAATVPSLSIDNLRNEEVLVDVTLMSTTGLLLYTIMALWDGLTSKLKSIECFLWISLTALSWNPVGEKYEARKTVIQMLLVLLILSVNQQMAHYGQRKVKKQKKQGSKIRSMNVSSDVLYSDHSDEEIFQETAKTNPKQPNSFASNPNTANLKHVKPASYVFDKLNTNNMHESHCIRSPSISPVNTTSTDLNLPFSGTKTSSNSVKTDGDLNASLSNLYLGTNEGLSSPERFRSAGVKPVLSPSRLKSVTQNSWTAGGFWRNSYEFVMPVMHSPNCSRSSSQSSGFVSQTNENNKFCSPPPSAKSSICEGDFEPINTDKNNFDSFSVKNSFNENKLQNTFYPNLSSNETMYIHSSGVLNDTGNRSDYGGGNVLFLRSPQHSYAASVSSFSTIRKSPDLIPLASNTGFTKGTLFRINRNWADNKNNEKLETFTKLRMDS